jgi:hypothetical protein
MSTPVEQPLPLPNRDHLYPQDILPVGPREPPRAQGSGPLAGRGGGRFAGPATGVDDTGNPVLCDTSRAPLSQPCIDYGLTTSPAGRIPARSTPPSRA